MIGSLRGSVVDSEGTGVVIIEAGGVGYEINVTPTTSAALGELGTTVFLRVHTRVREDAITLYGFGSADEKRCFEALISTHGVGPSLALALLAMYAPPALRQIVVMEDAEALARVPGVGKKTAARLLVELKTKFDVDGDLGVVAVTHGETAASSARGDVIAALTELGYGGDEIRRVLGVLPDDGPVEDLLRRALRELAVAS